MNRIDHFIFKEYEPANAGIAFYRVIFAVYLLVTVVPGQFGWISNFSDAFFLPPIGPALLFSGFPPEWFFQSLNFILLLGALCLAVDFHARIASLCIGVALLSGNVWAYSFGKINHDILLAVVPLVMAFSGWEGKLSCPREVSRPAWPMALLALLIALAMFTAALPKLMSGWLDPNAPATLGHLLRNHYVAERTTLLSGGMVQISSLVFWKPVDYGTLIMESGFLFALVSLRLFRLMCALAVCFHLGVWLIMGIKFTDNLLAYAAFVDWSVCLRRNWVAQLVGRFDRFSEYFNWWHLCATAVVLFGFFTWVGNPFPPVASRAVLVFGFFLSIVYMLRFLRQLVLRPCPEA